MIKQISKDDIRLRIHKRIRRKRQRVRRSGRGWRCSAA